MTSEAEALRIFLDAQRWTVLQILEELDEKLLRTPIVPSGWTPLGLVEHLGYAERHWFQEVALGCADPLPWPSGDGDVGDYDEDAPLVSARPTEAVFAFYRDQIERSNEVLNSAALDSALRGTHDLAGTEDVVNLRTLVLHMIEETARHAGHLDVARELLDGRTGLGPR
ncbi:uncharacterized protein DUF664 [Jatrophihabitans sp. GAS493]|uniref:DinB family protein n=1 Tax=Jatrophihabitans sp. GAS493 TaxID=1907575 RepID=UPI000BB7862D|nr:DinB family protein [Jatrophihabitans sp. GAS493]SOD72307.1 uncharacterized protein DUF664 [Jatrophihabitans sp. GAS493]